MPPRGRPLGAPRGDVGHNGRMMAEWAPRPTRARAWDNSDDEEEYGVYMDPDKYWSGSRDRFGGDELQFTGYDLAQAQGRGGRLSSNAILEDVPFGDGYRYSDEMARSQHHERYQAAYRRHSDLVQSANEKLRKAKAKGKSSVKLSPEEVEALQRSQTLGQQRVDTPPKPSSKSKSSRSSSSTSQRDTKPMKRDTNSQIFSNPSHSASRDRSTPKKSRTWDVGMEQMPPPAGPPAFTIAGPDGVPMYATPSYRVPGRDAAQNMAYTSAIGSGEASYTHDPAHTEYHADRQYSPIRNLGPSAEDIRIPRHRSASNAQEASAFFGPPPVYGGQGRRNVSGPADVSYSKVPRMQARSPLGPLPRDDSSSSAARPSQWPPRMDSRGAEGEFLGGSESSSDDDGEGVRVDIVAEPQGSGYTIDRRPVGGQVKRRKGRK